MRRGRKAGIKLRQHMVPLPNPVVLALCTLSHGINSCLIESVTVQFYKRLTILDDYGLF